MNTANDEDSLLPAGLLIAGGIGLFAGSYYVKDPKLGFVLKAGGILAALSGVIVGGEKLLDKLGISGVLKGQDKKAKVISQDSETKTEKAKASGSVSGRIMSPGNGAHLDPGTLDTGYDVEARVFNDTGETQRVSVALQGTESYAISADEIVGVDLGEWTIPSGQSVKINGRVGLGSYVHLPFASPSIVLSLLVNGTVVDTVHFNYD